MGSYDRLKAWSDFRVGLFTFAGLGFLILGVTFAGGDKGLLFQKISTVKAHLTDVGGLKKGSSVSMGGMVVGRVTDIAFKEGAEGNLIEVTMEVRSTIRGRIKADSLPAVRTQGMLGDRYIDLSTGSEAAEPLAEGKSLRGNAATDFDATLRQASEVLGETKEMLNAVNEQQGTVGQLFHDQALYDRLVELANQLNDLVKDFKKHPRKYVKFSLF